MKMYYQCIVFICAEYICFNLKTPLPQSSGLLLFQIFLCSFFKKRISAVYIVCPFSAPMVVLYRYQWHWRVIITLLTSYRYHPHMATSAVHFRTKEPAVLSDGVTLDAAEWVTWSSTATNAEQNPWGTHLKGQNVNTHYHFIYFIF